MRAGLLAGKELEPPEVLTLSVPGRTSSLGQEPRTGIPITWLRAQSTLQAPMSPTPGPAVANGGGGMRAHRLRHLELSSSKDTAMTV